MAGKTRKPRLSKRVREIMVKINQAIREAVMDHKRAGNPVAAWVDGKSVIIPPSKIPDLE